MKSLLIGALFLFPTLVFAQAVSFQNNLSYGSTGSDVSALQEFLVTQHLLAPQYVTGNFYSITLGAVKAFQTAESISPVSGYVGPITRSTINTILASEAPVSEENAATTTEPVDLSQSTTTPVYTPPQVIYVQAPVQTSPQSNIPTFGDTQPIVTAPAEPPTCTVAMGVNIEPSSPAVSQFAGIVNWTSVNAISGFLTVGRYNVNLTPVSGGTISDFSVHVSDQPYVATFTGTNGGTVTCTPNFTPATLNQMVSLTQTYNSQMQVISQDMTAIQLQDKTQDTALTHSGGEIGFVTGEIAQTDATAETKLEQDEAQENDLTTTYHSQMATLSVVQ